MASRGQKIAAACALACGLTAGFEGLRTHPYVDPGNHRTLTVCFGDTQVEMRSYTPEECQMLLETRQQRDYAPGVLKCVPGLADKREAFAASVDGAYNAGVSAFCRSPMAQRFNRSDWTGGCNAFRTWHTMPGTSVHNGLVRRRNAEATLCLKAVR
jgi:lysozyme